MFVRTILAAILVSVCYATSCFETATWPKLIGYGFYNTNVIDIDRRSTDGMLVLQVSTSEPDLVQNAGSSGNSRGVVAFDVTNNVYKWWKAFQDVRINNGHWVYFSPDGTKVLVTMYNDGFRTFLYLDAETGALLGTPVWNTLCCSKIESKDQVVISQDGLNVYFMGRRDSWKTA